MNQKQLKIVTIGGGSSYTPELIEGFILRQAELPIREIILVDIDEGQEKLEIVAKMARRQIKAAGLSWKLSTSLNQFDALKDADYVTTQFRVGQIEARIIDESIPLSYGVIGQETNGAGGIFKAFRTIPVIQQLIDNMRVQCPDAWLINFTNPAGMITEAAIKHFKWTKTIGLCNAPINHANQVAKSLDMNLDSLFFKFAGINHFHWHRVWDNKGNELTNKVIKQMYGGNNPNNPDLVNISPGEYNLEQLLDLNLLPCDYHRYYYVQDDMKSLALEDFSRNEVRAQFVKKTEENLFKIYQNENLDHKPEELSLRGGAYYSDAACEIISSIHNDKRSLMVVSTTNNGALDDLPYDSIVEVSSIITSHGPEPINWGKFESGPRGMLQLMKSMEELTIEAAISGDYNKALHAFTINPLIPSGRVGKEILDDLLLAHKKYLPQFKDAISYLENND